MTGWVNFAYETSGNFFFEVWKEDTTIKPSHYLPLFRCSSAKTTLVSDEKKGLVVSHANRFVSC